jgi:hypothetical protein
MARGPLAALVVAALVTTLAEASASAQDAGTATDSSPVPAKHAVVVTFVGAGTAQPALEASLSELFARHHLTMNPSGDVPPEAVLARVQIDLTSQTQAVILITDGRSGEVRALRAIPRDPSEAITREEIAHAVQSAVESELLVDQPPPPPPAPPPAPVVIAPVPTTPPPAPAREAPAAAPKPPEWFALDLTTLAGAGGFASGTGPDVRVGGGVIVASRGRLHPSIAVTALYTLPFDSSKGGYVSTQNNLLSLRVLPAVEIVRTRWLAIGAGVGGGIDILSVSPESQDLSVARNDGDGLQPATSRVDPIASGEITAQASVATGVVLVLSGVADVDLATRHYVFADAGSDQTVLTPWRVRPMALLGLAFTAVGDGLFARAAP